MKRNKVGLLLALALIGVLLTFQSSDVGAADYTFYQGNLLANPGFEEPFSSGVAQGWGKQHVNSNVDPKPANCSAYYTVLPKWSPELATGALILDGGRSQHIGNQWDTWNAVVMQDVAVTPGTTYRFSFWSTGRASNDQYPAPSDGAVGLGVRAGIDPNGGGSMLAGGIVWGPSGSPHMSGGSGNWQQFSVEATAVGNKITVFANANTGGAGFCRAHLDVWFDKAELVTAGPAPTNTAPPPPPQPTSPPQPPATSTPEPPTPTDTPEIPPTETPLPTDVPTNTPEPPVGGEICANAFADANMNGVQDGEEGWMAGITLSLIQDEKVVGNGISTGTEVSVCFQNLVGTYQVAQIVPRNLEMTNAPVTNPIEAIDGSSHYVPFGSWFATDTGEGSGGQVPPDQEGSETGSSSQEEGGSSGGSDINPLAYVGLGAIIIAIVLLAVLIVILLRQQRTS